jgi:hypothetical protein
LAINDYVDLAITGEIYTKGSWGIGARSNYRKRYKFSGSFNTYYLNTVLGDKGLPDYSVSKDFRVNWTHSQDPKANMYRTLSASVNFSTSKANLTIYPIYTIANLRTIPKAPASVLLNDSLIRPGVFRLP